MKTKYTPGPWRACHDGNCSCGMVWPDHRNGDFPIVQALSTCETHEGTNLGAGIDNKSEEFKGNTKLIAAAPDLLEACISALEYHQGGHSELGNKLREAIKKATE